MGVEAEETAAEGGAERAQGRQKTAALAGKKPNAKISAYFSIVKKSGSELALNRCSTEYFQPFFTKPHMHLAPINAFAPKDDAPSAERFSWSRFAGHRTVLPEAQRRRRSICLGIVAQPVAVVMKLLQFHANHRPPYYGTLRSARMAFNGRRPFMQEGTIDYDYDSDEDWGEDAEILDAESLSGSEGEDEEEEELSDVVDDEDNENGNGNDSVLSGSFVHATLEVVGSRRVHFRR